MNKVILMGRLTRDPNVRYSPRNNSQEDLQRVRKQQGSRTGTTEGIRTQVTVL